MAQGGLVFAIWAWMAGFPFPSGQFFQIHGNKLKLHSVCHLGQASVLRVAHTMLFFCIRKHTLNLLFSKPVQFSVLIPVPGVLRHFHIVLPNMPLHGFLAFRIFCAHGTSWTVLAKICPAFVFPVTVPVCGGIVQCMVFRADHIIKIFIVYIRPPRMAVLLRLWSGIAGGKNSSAPEDPIADPGRFVGAVCYYCLVLRIVFTQFIVQGGKRHTGMDISRGNMYISFPPFTPQKGHR